MEKKLVSRRITRIWFVFLRPALQSLLSKVVVRAGSLRIGFHLVRFGWLDLVEKLGEEQELPSFQVPDAIFPYQVLGHNFAPRAVWRLTNASYDLKGGATYLNNTAVSESFMGAAMKNPRRTKTARVLPRLLAEGDVIPIGQRRQNFYHWLLEDLPSLLRALEYSANATVAVPSNSPRYVWESLTSFGISNVVQVRRNFSANSIIIAERGDDAGWPHPHDIQLLRKEIRIATPSSHEQPKRFFVSRRYSRRSFANSSAIEEQLANHGVRTVYLEQLSFQEQVELFQQATLVIAEHGAGLSNIVFGRNGLKIVEVVTPDRAIQCFEALALQLGHEYRRILTARSSSAGMALNDEEISALTSLVAETSHS